MRFAAAIFGLCGTFALLAGAAGAEAHLVPRPLEVTATANCRVAAGPLLAGLTAANGDAAGMTLLRERWTALGIRPKFPEMHVSAIRSNEGAGDGKRADVAAAEGTQPDVARQNVARRSVAQPDAAQSDAAQAEAAQAYTVDVARSGAILRGGGAAALMYAYATLAQLAERDGREWSVPCVHVRDAPALRWRILSDDVSRGPLPTMRYFEERIRTLASFKMNGYSPYMEHVFVDPRHPLPAPLDGITPAELHELDAYARRFHVAFIPEQQTFAHMHETLRLERYAELAELPHGYLLSPANPAGEAYVRDLLADELAVVPRPPFFHIGSDEPSDLGRGRARALVASRGDGPVYAKHVADTANFIIAHSPARPMLWDDALAKHPELFAALPKTLVFVNWHYGSERTYAPYIDRIARGGFEQMVAPGALNWNQIYPDLDAALGNIDRFTTEGKAAHVLGLFQTVWHDDGETLFEATWYPVIYAAASGWESGSVERDRFARDFPAVFFGTDDAAYAADFAALAKCGVLLRKNPREYGDYLFWSDAFAPDLAGAAQTLDLSALRLAAEDVMAHLRLAQPPLHANAAAVMALAARRYDALGRAFQIATEARAYYNDARANADGKHDGLVYRGLFVTKYLFWEQRDALLALEPLVRAAWEYENRGSHEASVLERYHLAAQRALDRADNISAVVYRDYLATKRLPTFDEALRR